MYNILSISYYISMPFVCVERCVMPCPDLISTAKHSMLTGDTKIITASDANALVFVISLRVVVKVNKLLVC